MVSFSQDDLKKMAADKAAEFVKEGMLVGLGTGSTAKFVVENLGQKVQDGSLNISATPTSVATKELAMSFGIPIVELGEINEGEIDLVIDGADQIDIKSGVCLKGGGGAHYWEKMVAKKSKKMIVIVDESKVVEDFVGHIVPLEIDPSKKEEVAEVLNVVYREKMSDFGNLVGDVVYDGSSSLEEFESELLSVDGVIDTGVFRGLVDVVVVSHSSGEVKVHYVNK